MLDSLTGTLAGMNAQTLRDAMIQKQWEDMQQQVQSMPAPQPMPVPNAPNPLMLLLAGLAGSAGTALSKQQNFMPSTIGAIQQSIEAPRQAQEANREQWNKYDYARQKSLLELRVKKLDYMIGRADKAQDVETARSLQEARDVVENARHELDHQARLEEIKAEGEESRKTKMVPSHVYQHSDRAGGAGGKIPTLREIEQQVYRSTPAKMVPGKLEEVQKEMTAPFPAGLFGGKKIVKEKVLTPATFEMNPDRQTQMATTYIDLIEGRHPESRLAKTRLAKALTDTSGVFKVKDLAGMASALVALGMSDEQDIEDVIKAAGMMPAYTPSRKGGRVAKK